MDQQNRVVQAMIRQDPYKPVFQKSLSPDNIYILYRMASAKGISQERSIFTIDFGAVATLLNPGNAICIENLPCFYQVPCGIILPKI